MALRPAEWKNVAFFVEETSGEFGRRNVLHEFPQRDMPLGEDLGRAARKIRVTAIFVDKKDDQGRVEFTAWELAQDIITAMESEGAGLLIHPWLGRQWMQLASTGKFKFPRAEGGRFVVDLDLVEAGEVPPPDVQDDAEGQLQDAVNEFAALNDEQFEKDWLDEVKDALEAAAACVENAVAQLKTFMAPLDAALAELDSIINTVQSMISAPLQLISSVRSKVSNIMGRLSNPFSGITAWKKLLSGDALNAWLPSGSKTTNGVVAWKKTTSTSTSTTSSSTGALPHMPAALAGWMRRELIAQSIAMLPDVSFSSTAEVKATQAVLVATLNAEMQAAPSPEMANAVADLRVAVANYLISILPQTPDLKTVETCATLPAVVLLYQANGSIDALDDLIARNAITHPGFVPAGSLEVLNG